MGEWPSQLAPYINLLIHAFLDSDRFSISLFSNRIGDESKAISVLGEEATIRIKRKIGKKLHYKSSLRDYYSLAKTLLLFPTHFCKGCMRLIKNNGFIRGLKLAFNNHYLLRHQWDLAYFIGIQLMPHFDTNSIFNGAKILASSRGQDFELFPGKLEKELEKLNGIHVLSNYGLRVVESAYPNLNLESFIINPAFDFRLLNSASRNDDQFRIGSVCRLFWTKGLSYSLRAVARVIHSHPERRIEYHIVGEGEEREFLEFEAARLGIRENVIFHGWLSQKESLKIQAELHLYLLLSIEEGFNNSVVQAQAMGIPSVVSEAGGLPENVSHDITGFVVPKYDVVEASNRIEQLMISKELRDSLSHNARIMAKEKFSFELQTEKYFDMFGEMISSE